VISGGRYRAPLTPGASTEIRPESLAEYSFPAGPAWQS
jgi:L-fuconate dehydratase